MNKIHISDIEQSLKNKCWRISSYILSQYDFQNLGHPWQEGWCIFENQFNESFENNFFKEFLELAALIRALLDIHEIKISKEIGNVSINVGSLTTNDSEVKELTLREACNKTIHSMNYEINFCYSDDHPLSNGKNGYEKSENKNFKSPIIKTIGQYQGKNWTAEINFLKFIDQAINIHIP